MSTGRKVSSGASECAGLPPSINGIAIPESPVPPAKRSRNSFSRPVYAALYVGLANTTRSAWPTCVTRSLTCSSLQSRIVEPSVARSTISSGSEPDSSAATYVAAPRVLLPGFGLPTTTAVVTMPTPA
ncbi:Uncharacterised protein [Mycobacteroides abscessus subsp. abscessus]|nr:Uncharacterised protein [Mycobacteroides abscessus subsp. abscessus]